MKDTAQVIVNPVAGRGNGSKIVHELKDDIENSVKRSLRICETRYPGHGIQLAHQATSDGVSLLIAAGGDGTINEVVNGMLRAKSEHKTLPELSILNLGSGADFVRSLAYPKTISEQLHWLGSHHRQMIDVGKLQCRNCDGTRIVRYFINECQLGIGGSVVAKMRAQSKGRISTLAFASAAIKQLIFWRGSRMKIAVDDVDLVEGKILGIVVGNGRFCGGGMQLTPKAELRDGRFDILVMKDMNLLNRMLNFAKVYQGKHIYAKPSIYRKGRQILIQCENDIFIETDGELIGRGTAQVNILPAILPLRVQNKVEFS